jgi:hypothetical protein
MTNFVGAANK